MGKRYFCLTSDFFAKKAEKTVKLKCFHKSLWNTQVKNVHHYICIFFK